MNFSWVNRKTLRHASCHAIWRNAIWSMYKLTLIFNNAIKLESIQHNHSTTSSTILLWTEWVTWLRHMTKNVSLFLKASIFTFHSTTCGTTLVFLFFFVIFPFLNVSTLDYFSVWTEGQKWKICAFKRKVLVWTRPKLFRFQ